MLSIKVNRIGWKEEIWPNFMATYYPGKRLVTSRKLKKDWGMTVALSDQRMYTVTHGDPFFRNGTQEYYRIDFESEKRYSLFCLTFSDLLEKYKVRIPSRLEAARERYKRVNEGEVA